MLIPKSIDELAHDLAACHANCQPAHRWNIAALSRLIEYTPEDMTVTVEAGATLSTLQAALANHGQWLPVDPPRPDQLTLGALIATNANGPRRFGHGTVRDHLIGLKVVLASGSVVKSGGKVVKNVAGYDLLKLFVGSHGTLGIIVEATFKVLPRPAAECILTHTCDSLERAESLLESIFISPVTPTVLDLHRITDQPVLVVAFAGTQREVEWQRAEVAKLADFHETTLDYDLHFRTSAGASPLKWTSVLPSKLVATIRTLADEPFVARAGNGLIYHRNAGMPPETNLPLALMRQVKDAFDPKHILPDLPW